MQSACSSLDKRVKGLTSRVQLAVQTLRESTAHVISTATQRALMFERKARARVEQLDDKDLTDRVEEAEGNARLLDAVAALCTRALVGAAPVAAAISNVGIVAMLPAFLHRTGEPCDLICLPTRLCIPAFVAFTLRHMMLLCLHDIDAIATKVSGIGSTRCVAGAYANTVTILPRTTESITSAAPYVTPQDVLVSVRQAGALTVCGAATVTVDGAGIATVQYQVDIGAVADIVLSIEVCDQRVFHSAVPIAVITFKRISSYLLLTAAVMVKSSKRDIQFFPGGLLPGKKSGHRCYCWMPPSCCFVQPESTRVPHH